MKKLLLALVLGALWFWIPETSQAQSTITVNIKKAALTWEWEQGTGGPADGFRVKCGSASGQYTKLTVVTADTRRVPILAVIDGLGTWFCVVESFNEFGPSETTTNEVSFKAGDIPMGPTNGAIEAL